MSSNQFYFFEIDTRNGRKYFNISLIMYKEMKFESFGNLGLHIFRHSPNYLNP